MHMFVPLVSIFYICMHLFDKRNSDLLVLMACYYSAVVVETVSYIAKDLPLICRFIRTTHISLLECMFMISGLLFVPQKSGYSSSFMAWPNLGMPSPLHKFHYAEST